MKNPHERYDRLFGNTNNEPSVSHAYSVQCTRVWLQAPSPKGCTHSLQDRPDMELPPEQLELIDAVAAANSNTVVILNVGSPITMPWLDKVKGVLLVCREGRGRRRGVGEEGRGAGGGGLGPQFSAIFRIFSAIAFVLSTLRACWCPLTLRTIVILIPVDDLSQHSEAPVQNWCSVRLRAVQFGLVTTPQFFRNFFAIFPHFPAIFRNFPAIFPQLDWTLPDRNPPPPARGGGVCVAEDGCRPGGSLGLKGAMPFAVGGAGMGNTHNRPFEWLLCCCGCVTATPAPLHHPADAHPSARKSVLDPANHRLDSEGASGCPWSTARATARLRDGRPPE